MLANNWKLTRKNELVGCVQVIKIRICIVIKSERKRSIRYRTKRRTTRKRRKRTKRARKQRKRRRTSI